VFENTHHQGILSSTVIPARLPPTLCDQARDMARTIADRLHYVGVLCVEFFVLEDGRLVANEMAPRPHNSGHPTLEACVSSQFEQQARIVAGLPIGGANLRAPAVMLNLLGELWRDGEPDWSMLLSVPGVHLHLYSKAQPKAGRKMGHLTHTGATLGEALRKAQQSARVLGLPLPQ
jgi:5-(carboxyamino)imidazole ribonucleotide synthase